MIGTGKRRVDGSEVDDVLVARAFGGKGRSVVNGFAGDDALLGGRAPIFIDRRGPNNSPETALDIDAADRWSTAPDSMFGDATRPHTSILAQGTGRIDYYAVTLEAGARVQIDVDLASFSDGQGRHRWDSVLTVYFGGTVVARNDDDRGPVNNVEGYGSESAHSDSFVSFKAVEAGTYIIQVNAYGGRDGPAGIPKGDPYLLNVAATGHDFAAPTHVSSERLNGGDGNDQLFAGNGHSILSGDDGNDWLFGGDRMIGGEGNDTMFCAADGAYIVGGGGYDHGIGGDGNDVMHGGIGGDWLVAGGGDDRLTGGSQRDTVVGGDGADWISAGGGADFVYTGAGADTVVLHRTRNTLTRGDDIYDFTAGEDKLAVSGQSFGLVPGALDDAAFHLGTEATNADHRFIYDRATGALFFDADGSGAGLAFQIARLTPLPELGAADILVI